MSRLNILKGYEYYNKVDVKSKYRNIYCRWGIKAFLKNCKLYKTWSIIYEHIIVMWTLCQCNPSYKTLFR